MAQIFTHFPTGSKQIGKNHMVRSDLSIIKYISAILFCGQISSLSYYVLCSLKDTHCKRRNIFSDYPKITRILWTLFRLQHYILKSNTSNSTCKWTRLKPLKTPYLWIHLFSNDCNFVTETTKERQTTKYFTLPTHSSTKVLLSFVKVLSCWWFNGSQALCSVGRCSGPRKGSSPSPVQKNVLRRVV